MQRVEQYQLHKNIKKNDDIVFYKKMNHRFIYHMNNNNLQTVTAHQRPVLSLMNLCILFAVFYMNC